MIERMRATESGLGTLQWSSVSVVVCQRGFRAELDERGQLDTSILLTQSTSFPAVLLFFLFTISCRLSLIFLSPFLLLSLLLI